MKIRNKLLLIYGAMIAALLLVATFCIWAVVGWNKSATRLSAMHAQSLQAERLRANVYRQVNYAAGYLNGDDQAKIEFMNTHEKALGLLDALKANAIAQEEKDHIEGLEETQFEMVWIMNRFFERGREKIVAQNLPRALERLYEIADEVTDDVMALNQYYRAQENKGLTAAKNAGGFAIMVIIATAAIALLQFILLVFLLQRWLVRPIATMNNATRSISAGNLDIQIALSSNDEWQELSGTVNQMVQSLKASQQKLRNQERLAALGEIAAYAAHNIRNPLAGIRAAGQVLLTDHTKAGQNKTDPHVDETAESLKEIIETVDRLDVWLKRLLEYAKPLTPEYEQADLNQLVTQAITLAHKPFAQRQNRLEWRLSENLPAVEVDPILLEQALIAVATNAFQAVSEDGRLCVETAYVDEDSDIALAGPAEQGWLTITISDNGPGVPPHIQSRLFRVFVSSKDGGTGLGLAQAKKIVDIHKGEIKLESLPGEGTKVSISLPLHR